MKNEKNIKQLFKKLSGEKEAILKEIGGAADESELKERLKPYAAVLTDEELEEMCAFLLPSVTLSDDELSAVVGGLYR